MSPYTPGMTGENRVVCSRDGRREQRSCTQLWMLERIHAPLFPAPASLFFFLSVILFFCHSERSEESFPHTEKPILRSLRSLRMTGTRKQNCSRGDDGKEEIKLFPGT